MASIVRSMDSRMFAPAESMAVPRCAYERDVRGLDARSTSTLREAVHPQGTRSTRSSSRCRLAEKRFEPPDRHIPQVLTNIDSEMPEIEFFQNMRHVTSIGIRSGRRSFVVRPQ